MFDPIDEFSTAQVTESCRVCSVRVPIRLIREAFAQAGLPMTRRNVAHLFDVDFFYAIVYSLHGLGDTEPQERKTYPDQLRK